VTVEVELARVRHLGLRDWHNISYDGDPRRAQRLAVGGVSLGYEQAGARIRLQILRMHGHGADEEDGAPPSVQPIGHDRAEGETGLFA